MKTKVSTYNTMFSWMSVSRNFSE